MNQNEKNAPAPASVRIDKWLCAVRVFKTRGQAATACRLNQVTVAGQPVKASRTVTVGDRVSVDKDSLVRTLKVLAVIEKRTSARLVPEFLEDLTPPEEIERARDAREQARANRVFQWPGRGRPTKKDRRELDRISRPTDES